MEDEMDKYLIGFSLQGKSTFEELMTWVLALCDMGIRNFEIAPIQLEWVPKLRRFLLTSGCIISALHGHKSFYDEPISTQMRSFKYYKYLSETLNIPKIILHPPNCLDSLSELYIDHEMSKTSVAIETTNPSALDFYQHIVSMGITCDLVLDVAHLARSCPENLPIPNLDKYYLHVRGWNSNEAYTRFSKGSESVLPWIYKVLSRKKTMIMMLEYPYQSTKEVQLDMLQLKKSMERITL